MDKQLIIATLSLVYLYIKYTESKRLTNNTTSTKKHVSKDLRKFEISVETQRQRRQEATSLWVNNIMDQSESEDTMSENSDQESIENDEKSEAEEDAEQNEEDTVSENSDQESIENDEKSEAEEDPKQDVEDPKQDDEERVQIRSELATMSFEDLMKLKDSLGSKMYNEAVFGKQSAKAKKIVKTDFKRANKNRPREESAKRQVPFLGAELRKPTKSTDIRDPRFDDKCGEFSQSIFKDNYEFINDLRQKELEEAKQKIKKATGEDKSKLKFSIEKLQNQLREDKSYKARESIRQEAKQEIQNAKIEGRQPHYATQKELRTKELVKQFEELKNSGRLSKHLEKRRKKNVAKDRKKIKLVE